MSISFIDLHGLLEDINLQIKREMIFQNDGAPCHYVKPVRERLHQSFPRSWIGSIAWLAKSKSNQFFATTFFIIMKV